MMLQYYSLVAQGQQKSILFKRFRDRGKMREYQDSDTGMDSRCSRL